MAIEGVDVGGMDADDAEAKVRRALLRPLDRPLRTVYRERTWALPAAKLKLRADVGAAVREAMSLSREGDLPTRLGRYLGGDGLEVEVSAALTYSRSAVNRFVRHVAADLGREARSASVRPGPDALEVVASRPGAQAARRPPHRELNEAVVGDAPRIVTAHVHEIAPDVTTKEVAARYPSYLTLDRANFTLRLWKDLELARTYTVAVGQEGLGNAGRHLRDRMDGRKPDLARARVRLGRGPCRPDHPARSGEPDQGPLDGDLRRRRDPRDGRDRQPRQRRLTRMRPNGDRHTPAAASLANLVLVEVTIAPDAAPGEREIRLVTARGVSNPLSFMSARCRKSRASRCGRAHSGARQGGPGAAQAAAGGGRGPRQLPCYRSTARSLPAR